MQLKLIESDPNVVLISIKKVTDVSNSIKRCFVEKIINSNEFTISPLINPIMTGGLKANSQSFYAVENNSGFTSQ